LKSFGCLERILRRYLDITDLALETVLRLEIRGGYSGGE
jgi:hypothetical protein